MKNILKILLQIMLISCWSCSDESGDTPAPTPKPETNKIEISSSAPVVKQEGGTATISFTTNAAWTANVGSATSWVSVSPTNGTAGTHTLTIITKENETYDERNATLTINAGNASQNVTITQKQKDALIVTSNKVEIDVEGGNFSIEAQANIDVTYEIEELTKEWISSSESRGLTSKTLNFTAKANEKKERREGNIILKGGDGLTETVTVYQEGEKSTLVISSDDVIVDSEGDTVKIEIKSNVDYTMVLPETDWISLEESRAISAYTHYFIVNPNETYDQRCAHVFFQNEAEGLKDSISITQLQRDAIIVAKNEYIVESEAVTLDFSVNANVNFEVSATVDWIKQNTDSRGLMEKPLSFMIAENDSTESREGEILITYQELKQSIKIKQNGAIDYEALERKALIDFYKSTNGDDWINKTNWCSDKPLSEWYGITTYYNGRVRFIDLSGNNISGSLPEAIGNLVKLEDIYLSGNPISGTIPESIGKLKELRNLYIENTNFEGELPEDFFELENLEDFWARNNRFEGKISSGFGNLTKLRALGLSSNNFEGPIPPEIGELSDLHYLELDGNPLSCTIPKEIGKLKELGTLNLSRCNLYGSIPDEIGELINLREIDLCINQLSGEIPSTLGNLINLEKIDFHSNSLSGRIPDVFGNLQNLYDISLGNNPLSGDVPQSVLQLPCWQYMWWNMLYMTRIEVPIIKKQIPGPSFNVIDFNGNTIKSLEEYANHKFTVLLQWDFPEECYYSEDFIKTLIPLYEKYHDKGVEVIGWCPNWQISEEKMKDYMQELGVLWRNFKSTNEKGFGKGLCSEFPKAMYSEYGKMLTVNVVDSNNLSFASEF